MPIHTPLRHALLVVLVFGLLACGSPINSSNFEKIQMDMTVAEVNAILGEPTESSSINLGPISGTQSVWISENGNISIQFMNGQVKAKQFFKDEDAQSP